MLMELKASYWHHFEEGALGNQAYLLLNEAANRSLDDIHKPIHDWDLIIENFPAGKITGDCAQRLMYAPCIGPIF